MRVLDGFFPAHLAAAAAAEFDAVRPEAWFRYDNALERKRTCPTWGAFPPNLYRLAHWLLSPIAVAEWQRRFPHLGRLYPDYGLHGGGLHALERGGRLNPHLDYVTHPSLKLRRALNVIVYLTPGWRTAWGGDLGFWSGGDQPEELVARIGCRFNRAVIFETAGVWHGLPDGVDAPVARNSLAVYYCTGQQDKARQRALFAPTDAQHNDPNVRALIERRAQGRYT